MFTNTLLSRCSEANGDDINFDAGLLFRNLLLFDTYILNSIRLKELPILVEKIGYDQITELIKHKSFKIRCNATSTGSVGQATVLGRTHDTLLPFGSYAFATVEIADRKKYIHDCLENIGNMYGITFKQKKKLKRLVVDNLVTEVAETGTEILNQTISDISNNTPAIHEALKIHLNKEYNIGNVPKNLFLKIHHIKKSEFKTETNLGDILNFKEDVSHKIIERSLLAIASINQRICEMKAFSALSGFKIGELPIFERKLDFIFDNQSPENLFKEFHRVIELKGLPSFENINEEFNFKIDNFFKIRETTECKEFRNWLRETHAISDKELIEMMSSLRTKISEILKSKLGETVRFLTSNGLGLLDGGIILGPASGAVDKFITEKLFPSKGPISFINKYYPSVFEKSDKGT